MTTAHSAKFDTEVENPVRDEYDENQRLALLCEDAPDRQAEIKSVLEQLGYTTHLAVSALDAIERMRKNSYEIVVLDELFQGASPLDNPVLLGVQGMSMATRRYMFVALIGKGYKTFDNMAAFAKSVNLVVNLEDIFRLPVILRRAVNENNQFYRVLRDVLREAGKR
jgi:PleD family two-component response regulator